MNFEIPKLAWLKAVMMVRNGELAATNGHMLLLIKSDDIPKGQ